MDRNDLICDFVGLVISLLLGSILVTGVFQGGEAALALISYIIKLGAAITAIGGIIYMGFLILRIFVLVVLCKED